MKGTRLEPATREHLKALMSWLTNHRECLQWGGPQFRFPFSEQTFHEDTRWRELPSYVLANEYGVPLAFGQFYDRLGRCHLGHLIVSPKHRGAGLGKALVMQLAALGCHSLNTRECSLFVLHDNRAAKSLYKKLGFEKADYPIQHDWLEGCDYMIAPAKALLAEGP